MNILGDLLSDSQSTQKLVMLVNMVLCKYKLMLHIDGIDILNYQRYRQLLFTVAEWVNVSINH